MTGRWRWRVRGYYGPAAAPPKVVGELALETIHADERSRDLEVSIFEEREDIGRIDVEELPS